MTTLIINLPPEVYERLNATAKQQQKPIEALAGEWLAERTTMAVSDDGERVRAALRAAGLLVEPQRTGLNQPLSEDERAALADRLASEGVTPLSELIISEREGR